MSQQADYVYGVFGSSSLLISGTGSTGPCSVQGPISDNSLLIKSSTGGLPILRGCSLGANLSISNNILSAAGVSGTNYVGMSQINEGASGLYIRSFINGTVGRTNLYTVPAGKKAIFMGYSIRNTGVNTGDVMLEQFDGATHWCLSAPNLGSNELFATSDINGSVITSILDPGHRLVFNNINTLTCVIYPSIVEIPSTSNIKSSFINLPAATPSVYTIYTCPSNKIAYFSGIGINPNDPSNCNFSNYSGSSRLVSIYTVPSGDTAGIFNMVQSSVSLVSERTFPIAIPKTITAGASIQASLNNTGPFCGWVNVSEYSV